MKLYKIKKSNIDNKGLCASQDIKDRTKIIEYKGKIITKKQVEKDPKFDNEKAIYLFNINKKYDLDGDFKYNTARLINHSCNPNCEVSGTGLKIWVYKSLKDISKRWHLDKKFSPKMNSKRRNILIKGWSTAIKRALIN